MMTIIRPSAQKADGRFFFKAKILANRKEFVSLQ